MANVRGLKDLGDEKREGDEKQDQFFAGGLDQRGGGSGQNVIGPGDGGDGGSLFDQIARNAAEQGFGGSAEPSESNRVITLYRNGFTVDNGALRNYQDPENVAFMSAIQRGEVPRELQTGDINVSLVNKQGEDYTAPAAPAYVAFSGGNTLGGGGGGAPSSTGLVLSPEFLSTLPTIVQAVDENQPTTTLQIRTPTGQRIRMRMNQSASVLDLVVAIHGQYKTDDSYVLSAGFPPSDVEDGTKTLKEAGLLNAAVTLKKV